MTQVATLPFDPADPGFRADPHPTWRALRERAPVLRLGDGRGWCVTGYAEVRSLLRDPRVGFSSDGGDPAPVADGGHPLARARAGAVRLLRAWMHGRNPEDHARLRRLTRGIFSPAAVERRRLRVERLVEESVERATARGRMDVLGDFAQPLALTTAAEVVGIPPDIERGLAGWAREMVHGQEIWPTRAGRERGLLALAALTPQLRGIVDPPDGTLLAELRRALAARLVSDEEVLANAAMYFFTAQITTQHLIGNGVLALLRNREQWDLVREDPGTMPVAVEELLRFDTPVPMIKRMVLSDLDFAGETLQHGDRVLLVLAAAHRDPAAFPAPHLLDVTRSPNPHLAFGHDAYYCVGAALARLEADVAISALVRLPSPPRLATSAPEWDDTFAIRGLRSLPVDLA